MKKAEAEKLRTVVISGASTGIGRACALALDQRGFQVFAGIRKSEDADSLCAEASSGLTPIYLDVTDEAGIGFAVKQINNSVGANGITGLVNNAGIALPAPLEYQPLEEVRRQFETNVFGSIQLTQAFLPLIRRGRGRIVAISSIAGKLPMPFNAAHCGTKHALEGVFGALRLELAPWGIHVSIVEPGTVATAMVEKFTGGIRNSLVRMPAEGRERYGALLLILADKLAGHIHAGSPPTVVADAVLHALTAPHPHARYPVGRNARLMLALSRILPDQVMDAVISRFFGLSLKTAAE